MKLRPHWYLLILLAALAGWASPASAEDLREDSVQPCVDAYYGIGQPVDYDKAFKCFQDHDVRQFVILMTLNGDGTPKDPKRAQQDLAAWGLDASAGNEDINLKNDVQEHLRDPAASRADYCHDIAYSVYSLGFCSWIRERLQKQDFDNAMDVIRGSFTPAQQQKWDELLRAEEAYEKLDASRLLKQFQEGTVRGVAYDMQLMYVRENFRDLVTDAFVRGQLIPATADVQKQLASALQAAYQADVDGYSEGEDFLDQRDSSALEKQAYASNVAEYAQDAEASQQAWARLRDLCAAFARDAYKGAQKGMDVSASMTASLTRLRILELKNSPG
jgi:hypothetical protein